MCWSRTWEQMPCQLGRFPISHGLMSSLVNRFENIDEIHNYSTSANIVVFVHVGFLPPSSKGLSWTLFSCKSINSRAKRKNFWMKKLNWSKQLEADMFLVVRERNNEVANLNNTINSLKKKVTENEGINACLSQATSTLIRFRMPLFLIQRKRIEISASTLAFSNRSRPSTLAMRKRYVFVLHGRLIIEFMTSAFSKTFVFGVFARPH